MPRKILPIQSFAVTVSGAAFLPTGARIVRIQGECDTKPVYDFVIRCYSWNGASFSLDTKYAAAKNGSSVGLWKEFPYLTTIAAAPVGLGDLAVQVIAGTGVALQVFYAFGALTV